MNFWRRKSGEPAVQTVQLRGWEQHPFAGLRSFTPQRSGEVRLYQAVREAVPVVDAAICKLIRLSGGVQVFCESAGTQTRLRQFLERVPVGRGQYGMNAFLEQSVEPLLVCGGAVGEDGACCRKPGSGGAAVRPGGAGGAAGGRKPAEFQNLRVG